LASAIAATRGAQEAGATRNPQAALHLKLSEEQIATARKLMDAGNNQRADYLTLRAYNDAELALAIAREAEARQRAEQAENQVANSGSAINMAPSTQNPAPPPARPNPGNPNATYNQ
jgi:hypothetical protein